MAWTDKARAALAASRAAHKAPKKLTRASFNNMSRMEQLKSGAPAHWLFGGPPAKKQPSSESAYTAAKKQEGVADPISNVVADARSARMSRGPAREHPAVQASAPVGARTLNGQRI